MRISGPWLLNSRNYHIEFDLDKEVRLSELFIPSNQRSLNGRTKKIVLTISQVLSSVDENNVVAYNEVIFKCKCIYNGSYYYYPIKTYVDNIFSLLRGYDLGFEKEIAKINITKCNLFQMNGGDLSFEIKLKVATEDKEYQNEYEKLPFLLLKNYECKEGDQKLVSSLYTLDVKEYAQYNQGSLILEDADVSLLLKKININHNNLNRVQGHFVEDCFLLRGKKILAYDVRRNNVYKKIEKEIQNNLVGNDLIFDAYFTGSSARKDESMLEGDIISDIDILVIYNERADIHKLDNFFNSISYKKITGREINICFCKINSFRKSALTDYALSINFDLPIVKKLNTVYLSQKDKPLSSERWVYQLQSVVYYYSKYILTKNLRYMVKAYLNILRMKIYKEQLINENRYIRNSELIVLNSKLGENTSKLINAIRFLQQGKPLDNHEFYKLRRALESKLSDVSKLQKEFSILKSVCIFFENMKENIQIDIDDIVARNVVEQVLLENTGNNNYRSHCEKRRGSYERYKYYDKRQKH